MEKYLLRKIQFAPLRSFFDATLGKAQEVAEILTDKNPQNEAQLAEFWRQNQALLLDQSIDLTREIIRAKAKEGWEKDAILALLDILDKDGNFIHPTD